MVDDRNWMDTRPLKRIATCPLEINHWKITFYFGSRPIFRCYVSFKEGNFGLLLSVFVFFWRKDVDTAKRSKQKQLGSFRF